MEYTLVESKELIWCASDGKYALITRYRRKIVEDEDLQSKHDSELII